MPGVVSALGDRHLTAQGQDRKAEIVRQAEQLFTERGFSRTRMSDIAEAAGVTKGLLYWYFENKQALLAEIVVDMRSRLQASQREAIGTVGDPLGRMYLAVVASVVFIRANQQIYGLISYSAFTRDLAPALHESATAHTTDTARLIEEGQKAGVIHRGATARELAHGNAGVVNNYCGAAAMGHLDLDHEALGHLAAGYIVRSLAASTDLAEATIAEHGPKTRRRRGRAGAAKS